MRYTVCWTSLRRPLAFASATLALSSINCATEGQLRARAAADMGCSEESLRVEELDSRTSIVRCGADRNIYVSSCQPNFCTRDCTWVLDSVAHKSTQWESGETHVPSRPTPRPFPRDGAAKTLQRAAERAKECRSDDGPSEASHLKITFAPSGEVVDVELEAPYQGTPVGECVAKMFRRANVAAFDGEAVTVGKTFTLAP